MRIFIVTMILLLTTGVGFAADKQPEKEPKSTNIQKGTDQETKKEQKTLAWPRPYKSTEEISVDSTVPFPTDI
jgi:hypothetical protein